jgi:hypothetical protein
MHDEPEDRDDVTEPDLPKIKGQSKEDRKLLTQALSRFKLVANAEDTQRKLELDDLKFFDGDQWPQDVLQQRAGLATTAGAPAPARPCLTINKVKQPVRQVTNAQRQARLAIQVNPKSGGASQRTAEVLQGLIRHIEVESNAIAARSWAYHHAVTMGRGYYRILKQYSNDGDFDLDLVIKRIRDQFSVYLDPFAEEPDASDMEWAFVTTRIPLSRYKLQYPKSKLARMQSEEAFTALGDQAPGWMGGEGASRFVRVAEHWYVEHEKRTRILTANNHEGWLDDYEAAPPEIKQQMGAIVAQREVDERKVRFCKITALEVLEREEWEGRYIPIIQVIGDESYVNGKRGFKGIVRDGKDPNRAYNFMRSSEVEAVGLAPKAPWVIAFGQLEGFEKIWATANTYPHSYLPYHGKMEGSHLLPPPQRNMGEPAIQAIAQSVREADADIKATTGIGDPSLGLYAPSDRSGKAIETLKRQAEHGTSHYLENLASISMTYEGKVLLDLIPKVYDRPGRITRILSEDDEESMVALNQGYVPGPDGPIVVPDSDKPLPPEAILHTLNHGVGWAQLPDAAAGERRDDRRGLQGESGRGAHYFRFVARAAGLEGRQSARGAREEGAPAGARRWTGVRRERAGQTRAGRTGPGDDAAANAADGHDDRDEADRAPGQAADRAGKTRVRGTDRAGQAPDGGADRAAEARSVHRGNRHQGAGRSAEDRDADRRTVRADRSQVADRTG